MILAEIEKLLLVNATSYRRRRGRVFRVLDLKSDPRFKSSTQPFNGFILGRPEFNIPATLCK